MKRNQIMGEITALKSLLQDSDYQLIKLIENLAGCTSIIEILAAFKSFLAEFGELVNSRKNWREKINLLEAELEKLDAEGPEEDSYTE